MNSTKAFRTVIYHNLTPSHWFENVNPRIVADIEQGRKELPLICSASDRIIADSKYNASELSGYEVQVLELPLDSGKWDIPTNAGFASVCSGSNEFNILHVGRLAPNKCIEDIIKIFYFFHHYCEKKSRLWLVGIDIDTELYSFSLKRLVEELSLSDVVVFPGCLADEELKALYENSSAYLCMSEHEGFCLPLLEAMYFKLPVIAYSSTAVPDTLGDGGIVVEEKRHAEIAELLDKVCKDDLFRNKLIEAGESRVSELSLGSFNDNVKEVFLNQQGVTSQTMSKAENS